MNGARALKRGAGELPGPFCHWRMGEVYDTKEDCQPTTLVP